MGLINEEIFDAANHGFRVMFDQTFAVAADMKLAELLATTFESNSSDETYSWLGTTPPLLPWATGNGNVGGERVISKLRAASYTVVNKRWANGIEVDETDFADDKLGVLGGRVRTMALAAAGHYVSMLVDLLINGFTGICYDGLPFFSASHKDGDGAVYSNLLTATLDDSGAFDSAFQKLQEMKNENGEPIGVTPTHLLVGPSLRSTARTLVIAEQQASGATNTNAGSCELIVSSRLTGANAGKWFMLDLSKPIKPLVLQIRQKPLFVAMTRLDDPRRFMIGKFMFGVESRDNAGYGLPFYAVGSNGTT